ncbi:hypothetical protein PV326_004304 [Microctonus aethiopoides]|nr:hypothetical protein PV326_004304 [Microctonus aethiopoides]
MAQLISVKLSRFDGSPWGFRLQGGKDFGTPLIVQKHEESEGAGLVRVNGSSPAEVAGLRAGDSVIKVNNTDMFNLRHKDAQDVIVRAGNSFEITVQRGGSTWRPSVSPVTPTIPSPQPSVAVNNISPVTKTSLAAKKHEGPLIGSGHNFSPKPFPNGTSDGAPIKSIVNKQYNSPVGIYSEQTIAETLSAQAEVLAGGVVGVNFKKNEKNYNAENSEVFKMVQEADKEPKTPEPAEPAVHGCVVTSPLPPAVIGLRSVSAPETKSQPITPSTPRAGLPSGQNICAECERLIVGVFVRIKEKNLHVECFKCSTCGTSLKNVGYYNINNKLYCDIHAKLVARQQTPTNVYTPISVSPGGKAPAGTITAALGNHANQSALSPHLNGINVPSSFTTRRNTQSNSDDWLMRTSSSEFNNGSDILSSFKCYENGNGPVNTLDHNGATFTSTITIRTGNEVGIIKTNNDDVINECAFDNNKKQINIRVTNHKFFIESTNKIDDDNAIFDIFHNPNSNLSLSSLSQLPQLPTSPIITTISSLLSSSHCLLSTSSAIRMRPIPIAPSHLGTLPTVLPPSSRLIQTPTTNFGAPKSIVGSNIVEAPSSWTSHPTPNLNNSNFPRPQSQTVTESYHAECNYFEEEIYDDPPFSSVEDNSRPPSSVRCKSLQWPPIKSIEDITYPTASPIWIDPNPVLDRRPRHNVPEKRIEIEENFKKIRPVSQTDNCRTEELYCWGEEQEQTMEHSNCNVPFYRKTIECSETRRECSASNLSRPSSADGVRRSLTPTRITQPMPRPWTGTVTTNENNYGHVQAPTPPEPPVCRKVCTCRIVCERTSGPAGPEHEQEHTYHQVRCELCNPPATINEQEQQKESQEIVCDQCDNEVVDLSKLVPEDVAVCPKGVENQHNLYTETVEKDEGNIHIKKTTIYEKTVEIMSPNRAGTPCDDDTSQGHGETLDREVERFSGRKNYIESVDAVSSAIETKRMIEEAKVEEEKRRRIYEEECRCEQEKIKMAKEEEERREQNRLKLIQFEKDEKERRIKEQRRLTEKQCRHEEEERSGKHVSFSSNCETTRQSMDENIRPTEFYQREEYVNEEKHHDNTVTQKHYHEFKDEINIQENSNQLNQERRESLRDQVQVHKCLRQQQQASEKRQTLQERRLTNRFRSQSPPRASSQQRDSSCQRKHVQFITQTESDSCPLSITEVKNATPKEWKSEMVKALTTAPARSYSPLQTSSNGDSQDIDNDQCTTKRMYSSEVRYEEISRPIPQSQMQSHYDNSERSISPFTVALMTAPERPYTFLGEIEAGKPHDSVICVDRSETPIDQMTTEGYCHPAEILYTDSTTRQSRSRERTLRKVEGPCPLPTPPPDYKFRDCSVSPARSLSRSETPKDRALATGLKKPDTIPMYQKNLVATPQTPVDSRPYIPSRSPTPCRSKSPASGPPAPPECYIKAHAPRIMEPIYPEQTDKYQQDSYHMEEKTLSQDHQSKNIHSVQNSIDNCSQNRCQDNSIDEYKCIEEISNDESGCGISKIARFQPALPCPVVPQKYSSQSAISERIQRTGVRVLPTPACPLESSGQIYESRRICHQESSMIKSDNSSLYQDNSTASTCPNTGVTVLPCRTISDKGSRAGVVIVPCEGSNGNDACPRAGVRITPTPDRGLCVSPAVHGRSSSSCTGDGGPRSGGCEIDVGNCPASGVRVGTCTDGAICIAPCSFPPGVTSVQCSKPILKSQSTGQKPIPFPHIPVPDTNDTNSTSRCDSCPLKQHQPENIPKSSSETNCSFQPINQQPRTNLSNQLTRLTIKRDKQHVVQLFKPQAVQSSQSCIDGVHCEPNNPINRSVTPKNSQFRAQPLLSSPHHNSQPISKTQNSVDPPNFSSHPDLGSGIGGGMAGGRGGKFAGNTAPKRGRGILNHGSSAGGRQPMCGHCNSYVRGPFITALGQIWCPEHFVCVNSQCRRPLQDIGFVEEKGQLYCEYCFERFIAPQCYKCNNKIKGDCLNAIGKHYHPECFKCAYCGKLFGNSPFFLEDGLPYCEADWNELFTTKCFACGFPVEAGDRWVEALNNNYHSQCFNCTMCQKNLEGQSFYAKAGRPFCKNHAR